MRLAFGPLRLAPHIFWRLSPRELQAAIDGAYGVGLEPAGAAALSRSGFDALYAQFPD